MTDSQQQPVFQIQRMYLKDLSLEIPHAPRIFLETQQPAIDVSLDVASESIADGVREVAVTVTINTKVGDKTVFLVEAKQAGIFEMRNIPDEQIELILNIVCPNMVYPYLRANVADVIQRAGFPPIHLAEINFEAFYQQRLAQQQQQQAAKAQQAPGIIVPGRPN